MKSLSGKDLARLLEQSGWELKRIRGSHHVYMQPGNPVRLSVPIHGNRPLKKGLVSPADFPAEPSDRLARSRSIGTAVCVV